MIPFILANPVSAKYCINLLRFSMPFKPSKAKALANSDVSLSFFPDDSNTTTSLKYVNVSHRIKQEHPQSTNIDVVTFSLVEAEIKLQI